MNLNDLCAFCGNPATTDDHIPPKGLFPKPRPGNLIKVRACKTCNEGSKLDDEYFRDAILTGVDELRFPEAMVWSLRAINKLDDPKKRGYARTTLASVQRLQVVTPAGLYLGQATGRDLDLNRLLKSVGKYVRGLYFHHFGQRAPDEFEVTVCHHTQLETEELTQWVSLCDGQLLESIGGEAFVYKFVRVQDEPAASVWLLEFWRQHLFIGVVSRCEETEQSNPEQPPSPN